MIDPAIPTPGPSLLSARTLINILLQAATEQPMVVVMVVDETQENLLDLRFEPLSDVAALLKLHDIPLLTTE